MVEGLQANKSHKFMKLEYKNGKRMMQTNYYRSNNPEAL